MDKSRDGYAAGAQAFNTCDSAFAFAIRPVSALLKYMIRRARAFSSFYRRIGCIFVEIMQKRIGGHL